MSEGVSIPLPWLTPPLTGNRTRGNPFARANEVKVAKHHALLAIRATKVTPIVGAEVTLHYRPATNHRRDADGMFPTLKVCQDALVLAGVLPDDSFVHVPAATCRIHTPIRSSKPVGSLWLELTAITHYTDDALAARLRDLAAPTPNGAP